MYKRLTDIPRLVSVGSCYAIDVDWNYLEEWISSQREAFGEENFQIEPDFQRAHVWTEQKQIDYVEFCLRGGESARHIYWNCPHWSKGERKGPMQLVDGLQRFIANDLQAFGKLLKEYELRPFWGEYRFRFFVNELVTRAEILNWYLEINSGGVVHTKDELDRVRKLLEAEKK